MTDVTAYEIVPTHPVHVAILARTLRDADRAEIKASHGVEPAEGLAICLKGTQQPLTGLADGKVLCVFGCAGITALGSIGLPWMISSVLMPRHALGFLRRSKMVVSQWRREYGRLVGCVDARNTLSINWLKWLGFKLGEAQPFGVERLPFHEFEG